MTKITGLFPGLPFEGALSMPETSKNVQSKVPIDQVSAESMKQLATKSADQISAGNMMQLATKSFDQISQESVKQLANKSVNQLSQGLVGSQPTKIGSAFDSKTEKVISSNFPKKSIIESKTSFKQIRTVLLIWIKHLKSNSC